MKGVTEKTSAVLEAISNLECIKPYTLVGGTALSLQLGTRESEDLDFMSWHTNLNDKREVDWFNIKKELEKIGVVEKVDIFDIDHVEFIVNGVKLSFYANPNKSPVQEEIQFLNNIKLADTKSIGAMKMEVMLRRSKFRDYYDIYSIMKSGIDVNEMISLALAYSGHRLKSKNIIAMLIQSDRFVPDQSFGALNPIYNVSPKGIEEEIKNGIENSPIQIKKSRRFKR